MYVYCAESFSHIECYRVSVVMHLTLWYILFICHQDDVVNILLAVGMYVGGYFGLSESGLCVFCKLCPVGFLGVSNSLSVLL